MSVKNKNKERINLKWLKKKKKKKENHKKQSTRV